MVSLLVFTCWFLRYGTCRYIEQVVELYFFPSILLPALYPWHHKRFILFPLSFSIWFLSIFLAYILINRVTSYIHGRCTDRFNCICHYWHWKFSCYDWTLECTCILDILLCGKVVVFFPNCNMFFYSSFSTISFNPFEIIDPWQ